jgi:hypothetical protein
VNTDELKEEADRWRNHFMRGQKNWSVAHHLTVFGSIVCSVTAGGLLQVTSVDLKGVSAVLTSIAAALTSLAAAGGFERKWRSNRLSRGRIDGLLIDLQADMPKLGELADRLKDIIMQHDQDVVNEEGASPTTGNQLKPNEAPTSR